MTHTMIFIWRAAWIIPYALAWMLVNVIAWVMYGPRRSAHEVRPHEKTPASLDAGLRAVPLRRKSL